MTDPLERLGHAADAVARRALHATSRLEYETANRRGLLWVHALVGLWAGPLMILYGSASVIERSVGLWVRPSLAAMAFAGGLMLAAGLTLRPRNIRLEALGLSLLVLWDVAMTAGIMFARWEQHDFRPMIHIDWHGLFASVQFDPLPLGYVVAYPVPVYLGYVGLLSVHLWTLRLLRRRGLVDDAESR